MTFLLLIGVFSYCHFDLDGCVRSLYSNDLVHLSDIVLDVFNVGLQNVLE